MQWNFTKTTYSGHEAFLQEWEQSQGLKFLRKMLMFFWSFVFLIWVTKLSCRFREKFMCNSMTKKINTCIVVSYIWQLESIVVWLWSLHYLVKCNFTFCFQLRGLSSVSLIVMVKALLQFLLPVGICWVLRNFLHNQYLFILFPYVIAFCWTAYLLVKWWFENIVLPFQWLGCQGT